MHPAHNLGALLACFSTLRAGRTGRALGLGQPLRVRSLAATRRLLTANGVSLREGRYGGIWVGPQQAAGAVLYFFES